MMLQVQGLGLESALWTKTRAVIGLGRERPFRLMWLYTLLVSQLR